MLDGVYQHCSGYPGAIFEDVGNRDETVDLLTQDRRPVRRPELMATQYMPSAEADPVDVFIGDRNMGVAAQSNKALKWFLDGPCDHLCLCNDDLHVLGDFVGAYGKAHEDTGVGMFCFSDFTEPTYEFQLYPFRGYKLKVLKRFTGIMISLTRQLVERVGFFDAKFTKFGEEHSDYTIRCRQAGGIRVEMQNLNCLDFEHELLKHQDVRTSVVGTDRAIADAEASEIMAECSASYANTHYYRPYRLGMPRTVGGYNKLGIQTKRAIECGYVLNDVALCDS